VKDDLGSERDADARERKKRDAGVAECKRTAAASTLVPIEKSAADPCTSLATRGVTREGTTGDMLAIGYTATHPH